MRVSLYNAVTQEAVEALGASCTNSAAPAAENKDIKNKARRRRVPCALRRSSPFLGQVEEQHFGVFYASELDGLFRGDGRAIACFKWRAVQLNAASRYLDVGMPIFLEFVLHRFARAQNVAYSSLS